MSSQVAVGALTILDVILAVEARDRRLRAAEFLDGDGEDAKTAGRCLCWCIGDPRPRLRWPSCSCWRRVCGFGIVDSWCIFESSTRQGISGVANFNVTRNRSVLVADRHRSGVASSHQLRAVGGARGELNAAMTQPCAAAIGTLVRCITMIGDIPHRAMRGAAKRRRHSPFEQMRRSGSL